MHTLQALQKTLHRWMAGVSPAARMAAGLVGLGTTLVLVADLAFGVLADRAEALDERRARAAQAAVGALLETLPRHDPALLRRSLQRLRDADPELRSVALRLADGTVLAAAGAHAGHWHAPGRDAASAPQALPSGAIVVPIQTASGRWGQAEFAHTPSRPEHWSGWLHEPRLWLWLALPLLAWLLMWAYLRRVLLHLNPADAVPERLRDAFDGLTEGVALLEPGGRIVLANSALRALLAEPSPRLHGHDFGAALALRLDEDGASAADPAPWRAVLNGAGACRGLRVQLGSGAGRAALLNLSPITDAEGRVRGCLATLADLSETDRRNDELRTLLRELERSRAQIEAQNAELVQLATRDALTGLFNRRAFFDIGEGRVKQAQRGLHPLAVVMIDVDHFKGFNDRHGHDVGDRVLQRVAQTLKSALRQSDTVARYGGEEFCVLLEAVDETTALALAERARRHIEVQAGQGILGGSSVTVTASFGVCTWCPGEAGEASLGRLLKAADTALYEAKRAGRNRVLPARLSSPETMTAA